MNKQSLNITTLCDGLSALEIVGTYISLVKTKGKHTDLISVISEIWSTSPFYYTAEHVRAHQEKLQRPLTVKETLNFKMYNLAKRITIE